jgi:hypothetical protein
MSDVLTFVDPTDLADLATFVARAKRVDPDGAVRLVSHDDLLVVQVCPLSGVGGIDVIGMRVWRLAEAVPVDTTVPLAAITDRLAHDATQLPVPPVAVLGAAWAGIAPPRSGWGQVGEVSLDELRTAAADGIAEVAATAGGVPPKAAAEYRGRVWSRDLPGRPGVPAGMAFVAEALGFLGPAPSTLQGATSNGAGVTTTTAVVEAEPARLARVGSWQRLSTTRGHVLARRGLF